MEGEAVDGKARAIRFAKAELCWPLLFHVEPLLAAYSWKTALEVVVTDAAGRHEYADVASAQSASQANPPHRVELYAVYRNGASFKSGLWVVGFGPGQQPAVTVDSEQGLDDAELRDAVTAFLSEDDAPVRTAGAAPARTGGWRSVLNQPWTVQVVGGVIATLVAAVVIAVVTLLFN